MVKRESNTTSTLQIPMRGGIPARFLSGQYHQRVKQQSWKRWKTALAHWVIRKIWVLPFFRRLPMSWRTTFRTIWHSLFIIRKAASWNRWTRNRWKPSSSPCCKTASAICCWCAAAWTLLHILPKRISAISAVSIPCRPSTHWGQRPATFLRCACQKLPARCCLCSGRKSAHLKNLPKRSML